MSIQPIVDAVTKKIQQRSQDSRQSYLVRMQQAKQGGVARAHLSCSNLAHVYAASEEATKKTLSAERKANIGIVTAYNDMLSAHQPFERFPDIIKQTAMQYGATAQVAGGVPAMCDGVTQGQVGMELSLFSRDVIALSASVALAHNCFDAVVYLGVCDKIVPGLVISALTFGHLPSIFLPAGPMTSGISNDEKAKARKLFAKGEISRKDLLKSEMGAYHGPGTCTFYGTANSNQMLMEIMGLHLPGATFINPNTPLRDALTAQGVQRLLDSTALAGEYNPVCRILDEKAFVNGIVGLHATGGSTNLLIHLVAMAATGGIIIKAEDFAELSAITPLLARVYPNGKADINHYQAAGGLQYLITELLNAGLVHEDVHTVAGFGLENYTVEPTLNDENKLTWGRHITESLDQDIARPINKPFQDTGGLIHLKGDIGEAVMKISAIREDRKIIKAPAMVFHDQASVKEAFAEGKLGKDFVCVVRYQGPKANGMPELHGLTPILSIIQDAGYRVALLTDGRMSGASGNIPAAIHVAPEAIEQGPIAKIADGDMITIDSVNGTIEINSEDDWLTRPITEIDLQADQFGSGRELFNIFRQTASDSSHGASVFNTIK